MCEFAGAFAWADKITAKQFLQLIFDKTTFPDGKFPQRSGDLVYNPGEPFAAHEFGHTWNRSNAIEVSIEYFKRPLCNNSGLEYSGICATLASRGCGKSHIIDYLCRLHGKSAKTGFILGKDLNERLIPISISFNKPQTMEHDPLGSAKGKLFARLIHRALFDTTQVTWLQFRNATQSISWKCLSPDLVFAALLIAFFLNRRE